MHGFQSSSDRLRESQRSALLQFREMVIAATPQPRSALSKELPDLDTVSGQIGHAIIRASDGTIVRPPSGSLTERDVAIVYQMILEAGTLLNGNGEGLQQVTVSFRSVSYAVAIGGGRNDCLYIVKKRSPP